MQLRLYQKNCADAAFKEWEEHQSTLVVLPTGTGKTRVGSEIIRRFSPKRSIFLAHREELIFQAKRQIEGATGLECEIEMAEQVASTNLFCRTPVVISSIQTQCAGPNGGRMTRFDPNDFGLVIIDECFPAGTIVDGRPIESMEVGDTIRTHKGTGHVTHLFQRHATAICRLRFVDGSKLICTPHHPICTLRGFVPAFSLTSFDVVLRLTTNEITCLRNLRAGVPVGPIQKNVFASVPESIFFTHHDENEPQILLEKNEGQQPYEACGNSKESFGYAPSNGTQANYSWRQRTRTDSTSKNFSRGPRLGNRNGNSNQNGKRFWLSDLLQGGCWATGDEDCNRSGRLKPFHSFGTKKRCEENQIFEFLGVDGVEVFQQGSSIEFERLCPAGVVYNLEVSNGNTYFANEILVHNCHHATADTYKRVLDHYKKNPEIKILGLTATPDRFDEEALGQIFESVAYDYEIVDAINDGWLVPIEQQMIKVKSLDYSGVRITAGDLNGADLAAVMEDEKNLQGMVGATIQIVGNRKSIVFTASVRHAEKCCEIFNRHRTGMAGWICGATAKDERRLTLKDFAEGRIQMLCNVGIATEGFDAPDTACVVICRPTQSRALYCQMIGRGTRALTGTLDDLHSSYERREAIAISAKPSVLILDFAGNSGKHKLITTADILGGNFSEEVVERAEKKARETEGPVRMQELLKKSEEELKAEQDVIRKRMAAAEEARRVEAGHKTKLVANVKFITRKIDPFNAFDIRPQRERGWDHGKVLSEKQRRLLVKIGVDPDETGYAQGKQVLNEQFRRWHNKLATLKQCVTLKRYGYETKDMKMNDASKILDQLAKNGWKSTPEAA